MKMNISLILLLMIKLSANAQNLSASSDCITNPPDFSKMSYQEASQAVNAEQRKKICPEYIGNLVNQLRQGHLSNDNKVPVIYLLGELRPSDTNSVEILIEHIDLRSSKIEPLLAPLRWGQYPALDALIKIGKPVVNPILNHLPSEASELRRQLMCDVLKKVEGKEAAQNQIKQEIADESDLTKQANLEAVLKELEK